MGMPATSEPLAPGAVLGGRYQLVSTIGKGGMAQVFHARVQSIGGFERDVAVKVLLPEYASESDFVGMLLDEARIAGAILHPCVVGVLDVGRQGDLFYLVMEYVDGFDLRSILKSQPTGRLKQPAALHLAAEVLRGLQAVHGAVDRDGEPRRIIHRDVSPANVLVDRTGVVKLGDFGIAHASSRITRTRPGSVKGKLRYMAPEQLTGQPVDQRADLYAVGVMLLEALLGPEACEPKRMTAFGPVFSWSRSRGPGLQAELLDVLDRALAERPQDRYRDASAFRRDVMAALHRSHPGYGGDELVRDLALPQPASTASDERTDGRGLHDLLDVSDEPAPQPMRSFLEVDQKPTAPFRKPSKSQPNVAPVEPQPAAVEPHMQTEPHKLSAGAPLKARRSWQKPALIGGGALAALLSIAIAVLVASSGPASPTVPSVSGQSPVAVVTPSAPVARPLTSGKLHVSSGAGSQVIIGSTTYGTPCELELPVGQYQVRLVKHARRGNRVVSKQIVVEPGSEIRL